nr:hypothetical protein [uncultured Sphingomonas sp.]
MNAAYILIGAAFIALGAFQRARAKRYDEEAQVRAKSMSGNFFIIAGFAFIVASIFVKAEAV